MRPKVKRIIEKLHNISMKDISAIHSSYMSVINEFLLTGMSNDFLQLLETDNFYHFDTSALFTSPELRIAHAQNPVEILYQFSDSFPRYIPSKSVIVFTMPRVQLKEVLIFLNKKGYDLHQPFNFIELIKKYGIDDIFSQDYKLTIAHELTHWLDDTKNNRMLNKRLSDISIDDYATKATNLPFPHLTDIEINAQIHEIVQMKRTLNDWNTITIYDLILRNTHLKKIWLDLYEYSNSTYYVDIWFKKLLSRMAREGLLGASMDRIPIVKNNVVESDFSTAYYTGNRVKAKYRLKELA